MKVHLRKRKITSKSSSKPRYTLYLDIYYAKRKRKREFLGIYLDPNDDKTYRQEKLKLAENIKAKRMMELNVDRLSRVDCDLKDRSIQNVKVELIIKFQRAFKLE